MLLTGWRRVGADRFTLRARWPPEHATFTGTRGRRHDPLLAAETVRQSGLLMAHAEYGVPDDWKFLMWELGLELAENELPVAGTAADFVVDFHGYDVSRRGSGLASMRYEVTLSRADREVATGGARFSCVPPAVYRRLRGPNFGASPAAAPGSAAEPVGPGEVGPGSGETVPAVAENIVLAAADRAGQRPLLINPEHPWFRGTPLDHVPGMLLVEAARQAAEAVTAPVEMLLVSLHSSFRRYVEFAMPCLIEAEPGVATADGVVAVRVVGRQDGLQAFEATLGLRPDISGS